MVGSGVLDWGDLWMVSIRSLEMLLEIWMAMSSTIDGIITVIARIDMSLAEWLVLMIVAAKITSLSTSLYLTQ